MRDDYYQRWINCTPYKVKITIYWVHDATDCIYSFDLEPNLKEGSNTCRIEIDSPGSSITFDISPAISNETSKNSKQKAYIPPELKNIIYGYQVSTLPGKWQLENTYTQEQHSKTKLTYADGGSTIFPDMVASENDDLGVWGFSIFPYIYISLKRIITELRTI